MSGLKDPVLPINRQNIFPKNSLDQGLFILMTIGIPFLTIWEIVILFRYRQEIDLIFGIQLFFQSFIFINVVGNLFYIQRVNNAAKCKDLPPILLPGWKYCYFCQINAPPRSYHCPVCDICILRRDQHCMFAGCCIGFFNHKYYIMAIVYTMIGSIYYAILQWPHCLEAIGGFQLLSVACMVAPHIPVLFGYLTIYGFVCALSQIVLVSAFLLTSYLLFVQCVCIFRGQTIHEKRNDILLYDLGWKKNFLQVMGERWWLAILWPFATSLVEGDGVHFETYHDLREIKNV